MEAHAQEVSGGEDPRWKRTLYWWHIFTVILVHVNSYGCSKACGKTDADLIAILIRSFDFRPGCLQRDLNFKVPQFQKLALHGHFGRSELESPWEKPKELK